MLIPRVCNNKPVSDLAGIAARVGQLDASLAHTPEGELVDGLKRCIAIISQTVPPGSPPRVSDVTPLDAAASDEAVRGCRLLSRLAGIAPAIVDGPIDRDAQYWVSTGKPPWLPPANYHLDEAAFVPVAGHDHQPSTKPFRMGLFTSTRTRGATMWSLYLRGYENSDLFPKPWIFRPAPITGHPRIAEIRDATGWAGLLDSYPRRYAGFVYPDWSAIADNFDAVHMTLRAVVTIQGNVFSTRHGPTTTTYYDVESTFWLRWCFETISSEIASC